MKPNELSTQDKQQLFEYQLEEWILNSFTLFTTLPLLLVLITIAFLQ